MLRTHLSFRGFCQRKARRPLSQTQFRRDSGSGDDKIPVKHMCSIVYISIVTTSLSLGHSIFVNVCRSTQGLNMCCLTERTYICFTLETCNIVLCCRVEIPPTSLEQWPDQVMFVVPR